jgi:hypothetical protein
MRTLIGLMLLCFSLTWHAYASVYILDSTVGPGVSKEHRQLVRKLVEKVIAEQDRLAPSWAAANYALKAIVAKHESGYVLKFEKREGGKGVYSELQAAASETDFESAVRRGLAQLKLANSVRAGVGESLPTAHAQEVVKQVQTVAVAKAEAPKAQAEVPQQEVVAQQPVAPKQEIVPKQEVVPLPVVEKALPVVKVASHNVAKSEPKEMPAPEMTIPSEEPAADDTTPRFEIAPQAKVAAPAKQDGPPRFELAQPPKVARSTKVPALFVPMKLEGDTDRSPAAEEPTVATKPPVVRNRWYAGIGPAWSEALLPGTPPSTLGGEINEGTKFNIHLAFVKPTAERWDFSVFYDASFNSASMGGSPIAIVGLGATYLFQDRVTDVSPIFSFDLGYGGANRNIDATGAAAVGFGVQFYRTEDYIFEVIFRDQILTTRQVSNSSGLPSIQTVRLGVYFD